MFGVLRGASCSMRPEERAHWMNHICGVCLALRDNSGQASRLCTNYDAALISVLTEAQSDTPLELHTSRCALRGQRFNAEVISPNNAGAQYAAAIALTAGATKLNDHLEDKDTWLRHLPWVSGQVADRWQETGRKLGHALGFSTATIHNQTGKQTTIEAQPGRDFFFYAQPTELAVASAFQHTAVIANRPHNAPILHEIGRMFGRIMYLLDSYQDHDEDLARGHFNPLAASLPAAQRESEAQRIFKEAHTVIKQQFAKLDLPNPDLARKLLVQQLKQRGYRLLDIAQATCATCSCRASAAADAAVAHHHHPPRGRRRRRRRGGRGLQGCCQALICCDCCTDCCCCGCCDFEICECEDGGCEICECSVCCCECEVCDGCCCDCDCG